MVKRKDDKNRAVEVEDLTGNTIIYFSDNDKRFDLIVNDEVLGVFCEMKNDRIEVLNVIWPDIPLKREIASTKEDTYCIFLSNLSDNQEKYDKLLQALVEFSNKNSYIFFIGSFIFSDQFKNFLDSIPADISKIFVSNERLSYEGALHFSEPALIKVEDSIVLLLCDGSRFYKYKKMWPIASTEILLNVLKKRQLSPEFDIMQSRNEDIQMIDIVPDIFVSGNIGEPNLTNYKGTTIVANGSFDSQPIYYVINLKTRESIKINLS